MITDPVRRENYTKVVKTDGTTILSLHVTVGKFYSEKADPYPG